MFPGNKPKPDYRNLANKNNHTTEVLKRNPRFSLSIITDETDLVTIGTFGFQSCKNEGVDKYGEFGYTMHEGAPLVNGKFAGRLVCDVLNMVDNETHMVVLARVVDTVKGEGHPMTFPDFITFSQFFG